MWRWVIIGLYLACMGQMNHTQDAYEITHDGYERSYVLMVGEAVEPDVPSPVVVALHGAGGNGIEFALFGGFMPYAEASNVIMIYPDGLQQGWNYLPEHELATGELYTRDWDFVWSIIDEVRTQYAIDDNRISIVGYSNGGMLALRMMCHDGDKLASIGVIGANFIDVLAQYCLDMTPTPLMMVLGMDDRTFPWQGYTRIRFDGELIVGFSMIQTLNLLIALNDCNPTPDVARISTSNSSHVVVRDQYEDCAGHGMFRLLGIAEYGHGYPISQRVISDDNGVVDIAGAMWEFLMAQERIIEESD
jgi:polyhydroxybutyrate depolymerase